MSFLFLFFFFSFFNPALYAKEDARIYSRALQAARSGQMDFAFMHYRALAEQYPESKLKPQALFAQGEYYFLSPNIPEAASFFNKFAGLNPAAEGKLFALAYLLKIARLEGNKSLEKDLQKTILTLHPVGLVFSEFKEYEYRSPLNRRHKAVFYIDKVLFYVQGEMFVQISF
jgi:outer membrane protein assembly factor BamD (BamD/ComL family)